MFPASVHSRITRSKVQKFFTYDVEIRLKEVDSLNVDPVTGGVETIYLLSINSSYFLIHETKGVALRKVG
jgi:hypothetical protein